MPDEPLYLTTPLYYVNAEPHLGSTYTTMVADTLVRFWRQRGRDAFFVTGADEHGDKIAQAAADAGVPPQAFVDRMSGLFRSAWQQLGLDVGWFIRTTDPAHEAFVQKILREIHARGDIYFDSYRGLYCYGCERFYQERELVGGLCPDHRTAPTEIAEENYFFRMEKYQERVLALYEAEPERIMPDGYRREVLALLREPIGDLCISRPKSRLQWGIDLPFDDRFVTYVWFDALLGYVSAVSAAGRPELWPHVRHLIGKDIVKTHAVYWPTMLMAAELPLFRAIRVHGYWTRDGAKMSKSLGNVVDPLEMQARYGHDVFRYFLLREMAFGQDALQPLAPDAADLALREAFGAAGRDLEAHVEQLAFHRGLEAVWRALDHANKYVTDTAPFRLAKDPAQRPRVGAILHELCEALRTTAQLVAPFLPETSRKLLAQLGLPESDLTALDRAWGATFPPGHRTQPPEALFPRIEATGS